MPKQFSNLYTVGFVGSMSLICSLLLAAAAGGLQQMQAENLKLDRRLNVLKSFGLIGEGTELGTAPDGAAVNDFFESRIEVRAVKRDGDDVTDTMTRAELEAIDAEEQEKTKAPDDQLLPVFVYQEDGREVAYAIPIFGKGLWSTLYGYLALKPDLDTVKGITFYKHNETPGLGAEVENPKWQSQWEGKEILEGDKLVSITVAKGQAENAAPAAQQTHYVDGISGATMTCNGVTDFLLKDLEKYQNYFAVERRKRQPEGM